MPVRKTSVMIALSSLLLACALPVAQTGGPNAGNSAGKNAVVSPLAPGQTTLDLRGTVQTQGLATSGDQNLAGTQVSLANTPYKTLTDAKGAFNLNKVPADTPLDLTATRTLPDGTRYAARQPLTLAAALDAQSLLLTQAGSIYGSVTAEGLSDLTGINVFVAGTPTGALTDAEGNYFLTNLPAGSYVVTALKEGYQPVQGTVTVESGKPVQLSLALKARLDKPAQFASVSGQVLSSSGPVAGAIVSLLGESYAAITDKDGKYRLSNVLPQNRYTLQVQREGYELLQQELTIKAGEALTQDLSLKADAKAPAGTIKGILADAKGQPVANATVSTEPPTRQVSSDAQGQFEIPNVLPGSYYLRGSKDGQLKGSRFIGVDPAQTVTVPIKGPVITGNQANVCDQQNINNININIPGAEVTVVVDNHNDCKITVTQPAG